SIPKSVSQFPESWYSDQESISYDEGIFVGYRYFDKHNLDPAFPFGHGLSYTSFEYGAIKIAKEGKAGKPVNISIPITNVGDVSGKEIVQLYVRDVKSSVERPEKELKAFRKIALSPGETKKVDFVLNEDAFSYFSEKKNQWVLEKGEFEIWIGSSSSDIRRKASFIIND
ncbi:MAG: fibronectin type III-like domain-contianing protein, partial [Bacteroidota bacterium]